MFKVIEKVKSIKGVTTMELLISISILSILAYPAYLSMVKGSVLFHNESLYQDTISDVHSAYEEINSKIRIGGFHDHELIETQEQLQLYPEIEKKFVGNGFTLLRVGQSFYYFSEGQIFKYSNKSEKSLVENVVNFTVSDLPDSTLITITTIINVNGRQETIKTSIYDRYRKEDG